MVFRFKMLPPLDDDDANPRDLQDDCLDAPEEELSVRKDCSSANATPLMVMDLEDNYTE